MKELALVLNNPAVMKPLSGFDIDEGPGALPVHEQLKRVLAVSAVKVVSLFNNWDEDGNGLINCDEFETGLRAVRHAKRAMNS